MDVKRKTRTGRVLSDKMDKTVVVAVDAPKRHPVYKKTIRRIKKYYAHDEKNEVKTGDMVLIEETRPYSKLKRWRVARVLVTGEVAEIKPQEITSES
jgi:small subunit ribosomal protein S17